MTNAVNANERDAMAQSEFRMVLAVMTNSANGCVLLFALSMLFLGCRAPTCMGTPVPAEVWLEEGNPHKAWTSPDASSSIPGIVVSRMPLLSSGGLMLDFGQPLYVYCEDSGSPGAGEHRARRKIGEYERALDRTDDSGRHWTLYKRN
jgi:hypothetical protein